MMATSFAQTVTQFATLRTLARIPPRKCECAQLIRDLFPKARTEPHKKKSRNTLFEVAWSFLSQPTIQNGAYKVWAIDARLHRTGDLPARIASDISSWYFRDMPHRTTRDPTTGQTLPAFYVRNYMMVWLKRGQQHRTDRDARTGLTFPAVIRPNGFTWMRRNLIDRVDVDPTNGLILPALVRFDMLMWYKNGNNWRDDQTKFERHLATEIEIDGDEKDWKKFADNCWQK